MVVPGEKIIQGPVLVVGTGSIGLRHLATLGALLGGDVLALPARPGREYAPELAGVRVVTSLGAAKALAPTVAIIATDTGRHLSDAAACIEMGCHVLVEKPLAPTLSGVRALVDLGARAGKHVHVACCLRFHATVARFRELLPSVGRVHDVRIECQSYLPDWRPERDYRASYAARAAEGGALRDLIHEVDYALWLFGRPAQVVGSLRNTGALGIESEEAASLSWESRGAHVSLELDYLTRPPRRVLRASGEHGVLTADLLRRTVTFAPAAGEVIEHATPQERDGMMEAQARAFLELVARGAPSPGATLDDGAAAVAVCDAVRASSLSGRVEEVPSW